MTSRITMSGNQVTLTKNALLDQRSKRAIPRGSTSCLPFSHEKWPRRVYQLRNNGPCRTYLLLFQYIDLRMCFKELASVFFSFQTVSSLNKRTPTLPRNIVKIIFLRLPCI